MRSAQVSLGLEEHKYAVKPSESGECLPDPRGVNVGAAAALGEIPSFAGCTGKDWGVNVGVNIGESTLRLFLAL